MLSTLIWPRGVNVTFDPEGTKSPLVISVPMMQVTGQSAVIGTPPFNTACSPAVLSLTPEGSMPGLWLNAIMISLRHQTWSLGPNPSCNAGTNTCCRVAAAQIRSGERKGAGDSQRRDNRRNEIEGTAIRSAGNS